MQLGRALYYAPKKQQYKKSWTEQQRTNLMDLSKYKLRIIMGKNHNISEFQSFLIIPKKCHSHNCFCLNEIHILLENTLKQKQLKNSHPIAICASKILFATCTWTVGNPRQFSKWKWLKHFAIVFVPLCFRRCFRYLIVVHLPHRRCFPLSFYLRNRNLFVSLRAAAFSLMPLALSSGGKSVNIFHRQFAHMLTRT